VRWAILALAALALSGCETTAEKSAKLEREAKLAAHNEPSAPSPTSALTHPSRKVKVGRITILHGPEGLAAVVPLQNTSGVALHDVPLVLKVVGSNGRIVYSNEAPGEAAGLGAAPLIAAHGRLNWIDDQVQATGQGQTAKATVGEVPAVSGPIPKIAVSGAHLIDNSASGPAAEGEVVNSSSVSQTGLIVYGIARKAGTIVAAGRAVLEQVPAGASVRFQLFFVGDPTGGQLEVTAPPSTL
jgi:hypothetical protein